MLYLFYWISSISLMSSWFVIRRCILLTVSVSYPHLIHILSYPHHCCRRHRHPGTTLSSPRSIGVSLSYSFVISLQHIGILASCTSRTFEDLVGPRQRYRAPRETWGIAHLNAHNRLHMGRAKGRVHLQMGRIGGVFSLGLKPFENGSCMQTGGNIVRNRGW